MLKANGAEERWRSKLWGSALESYGADLEKSQVLVNLSNLDHEEEKQRGTELNDAVARVTKSLVMTMVAKPKKFWDIIRNVKVKGGDTDLPSWMNGENGVVTDKNGL